MAGPSDSTSSERHEVSVNLIDAYNYFGNDCLQEQAIMDEKSSQSGAYVLYQQAEIDSYDDTEYD